MKRLMNLILIIITVASLLLVIGCQQQPAPTHPEIQAPQTEPVTPPKDEITPEPSPPKSTSEANPIPTPTITPTPTPTLTPTPASFRVISLDIDPTEAMAGDTVNVIAKVKNGGGSEGTYNAILTLDGTEMDAKSVKVAPGTTEVVNFSLVRDATGIHRLKLADMSGILVIKGQEGLPSGYIVEKSSCHEDEQVEIFDITYMSDGLKVKGYLAQPKASGIYPAVIWNRGGNRDFSLLEPLALKIYAENGYVAIGSQYRGNGGSEGKEEFGGADVNDVLNIIPALKSLPNVDTDKIGMVGYSRGSMMTYIALKEQTLKGTDDIKAACTVAGPTDLRALAEVRPEMLNNVMKPLIGGSPSQLPEEYDARSAIYWADKINVPLLMQHGDADESVPVEESERLAQELDKYGKVYKLITYPGDDHSLSAHKGGRPEIFSWLRQYLR